MTNAIIVFPVPTGQKVAVSINLSVFAKVPRVLTPPGRPQTGEILLSKPRLEIRVVQELLCSTTEPFMRKPLMDFFMIIT